MRTLLLILLVYCCSLTNGNKDKSEITTQLNSLVTGTWTNKQIQVQYIVDSHLVHEEDITTEKGKVYIFDKTTVRVDYPGGTSVQGNYSIMLEDEKKKIVLNLPGTTTIYSLIAITPSGNKNDYLSLAPYWWPNPNTTTGLPYIQKDGQTNPEVSGVKDNSYVREISQDIRILGLAYYFTGNEQYAAKATELLKVFFLDSATRMNPHLKYAQIIQGDNSVYGTGIVDTESFPDLIDGVQLLAGSSSWTPEYQQALQNWFSEYLTWLLTSDKGKKAKIAPNNIGTTYDVQVVSYALFVGNKTLAKSVLEKQTYNRIESQFTVLGEQTYELNRTNAWTYCNKNLAQWFNLANCAESAGINLWDYVSINGKSLKKVFEWMIPYGAGTKPWTYQQINIFKPEYLTATAREGSTIYKDVDLQILLSSTHERFMAGAYMELLTYRYY